MALARIKKGDVAAVISGANMGKTGKVLAVDEGKGTALVEGVNLVKKTMKKSQERPQGAITDKEAPMRLAKILLYCPDCKKGVRARNAVEGDKKARKCAKCGHSFDS